MKQKVIDYLQRVFTIDKRALAVFRVALGGLVILDVLRRSTDLVAHYTSDGVLAGFHFVPHYLSHFPTLHLLFDGVAGQVALTIITVLAAISLVLGYKTRASTILVWYLIFSVQVANPYVLQRGDTELLLLLFWAMFLPLGQSFSIDRALRGNTPASVGVWNLATAALVLQVGIIYFSAFFYKTGAAWKTDFTAVGQAFLIDMHATDFARFLVQFDGLMMLLTISTVVLQFISLPLLLSPIKTQAARIGIVILLMAVHIAFIFTLHIGLFAFISLTGLVVLLPKPVWDALSRKLFRKPPLEIYYDRNCLFCRKAVWLIKVFFLVRTTHIGPAQENDAVYQRMQDKDSWVVVDEKGNMSTTFQAGVVIAQHSGWLAWLAVLARPKRVQKFGEKTYRFIAQNRKYLPLPAVPKQKTSAIVTFLAKHLKNPFIFISLLLVVMYNAATVTGNALPGSIHSLIHYYGLDQNWSVFAPEPLTRDGWFVMSVTDATGAEFDVWQNQEPNFAKPANVSDSYRNQRWRKYLYAVTIPGSESLLPGLAKWMCAQRTDSVSIRIIFVLEKTVAGRELSPEPITLYEGKCS